MQTLSALMTNPLDAVSGLMETVLPATPTSTAAGSTPNPTFTEDTLRMILHNIFTGDSRLQGQMLSKYWSPDATYSLNEGVLVLQDRDSLATLLRGVQLTTSVEPEILELTSTTDSARVFGPGGAVIAATNYVIAEFKQEMSLPDLFWWNPAWNWVNARLWGPVSGQVLSKCVQIEEPFVSRLKQYTSGGAGYLQALIWLAQDAATGMKPGHHQLSSPLAAPGTPPKAPPAAATVAMQGPDVASAAAPGAALPAVDEVTSSVMITEGTAAPAPVAAEASASAMPMHVRTGVAKVGDNAGVTGPVSPRLVSSGEPGVVAATTATPDNIQL